MVQAIGMHQGYIIRQDDLPHRGGERRKNSFLDASYAAGAPARGQYLDK